MENQRPGFWGKRLAAILIDALIITLFLWILNALLYPLFALTNTYFALNYWPLLAGLIIVLYFTYLESKYKATIGKSLFKIKVESSEGQINFRNSFLRNLSKFLWIPLILDLLVGWIIGARDRYLDRLSKTYIVSSKEEN
ncbi:MAG TPA: RDD family protein [Methanobacteriaceae archaeon]|nr:RDD family protein [Methanobacteriaceae archaeon]